MADGQPAPRIHGAKKPLVSIIVLNYNGLDYLRTCLSSLQSQTYPNYKIIVYDNASTDGSAEFIQQNFPDVTVIEGAENVGFAKGNNLAINFALRESPEYVFLVNNDTESERSLLEKLVSTFQSDGTLGVVSPAVYNLNGKTILQEMGMTIDRFGYPIALKSLADQAKVFFVSGCAMMIQSGIIRKIGAFDEEYFMFAEDLDLCWRAQLCGYTVSVNQDAKIYHAGGGSLFGGVVTQEKYETNVTRIFLRERNTLRTLIKNYTDANLLTIVPLSMLLLFLESFLWLGLLKPEVSLAEFKAIYCNLKTLQATMRQRQLIQSIRSRSDGEIKGRMISTYGKIVFLNRVGIPRLRKTNART